MCCGACQLRGGPCIALSIAIKAVHLIKVIHDTAQGRASCINHTLSALLAALRSVGVQCARAFTL
jgi:hypothetical protein